MRNTGGLLVVVVAIAALGGPQQAFGRHHSERGSDVAAAPAADSGAAADSARHASAAAATTLLDTLNAGGEVRLTPADFPRHDSATPVPAVATVASPVAPVAVAGHASAAPGREVFRIQCAAATQASTIEAGKAALQPKVSWPVRVMNVPPYYKLQVGEFGSRAEADKALFDVKGLGYPSAWIVRDTLR